MRSHALLRLFCILIWMSLCLAIAPTLTVAQAENDEAAAMSMLGLVNEWRVQQGLAPLALNPILNQMALAQASYVLPKLKSINDESEFHRDAQGRDARQRAAALGWPSYGRADRIEAGENAAVGSVQFGLRFWKGSEIHARAALSPAYREAGIAALPNGKGTYLFLMTFGSRPGVLPVMASPDGKQLYLTTEQSRYATANTAPMQLRVFDASGQPLTDTLAWKAVIDLPTAATGENIYVLVTQGTTQSIQTVDLKTSVVVLPASTTVAAAPTPVPAQPTAPPTVQPTAAPGVAPATAVPQIAPTNTPLAQPASVSAADILLIYSRNTLTLVNNSGQPVNLIGLTLTGQAGSLTIERWQRVSSFPIDAFPSGQCLKVNRASTAEAAPTSCRSVRSIVDLTPERVFWAQGSFTVQRDSTVLATCDAAAGQCAIDLP
ncbi:MAG: hypothetical protein JNM70_07010 [Anaerolineae bacterium]|nr:hypothetical protein [Anaerolineae bacterium]